MSYLITNIIGLIAVLFLFFLNRNFLIAEIKKTDRKFLASLLLFIVLLILIFSSGLNFYPTDREWEQLTQAKYLGAHSFDQENYGLTYPVILSLAFKIFGANPEVATILNLLLAVGCIFLVFFLTKFIFRNNWAALFAAIIFAIHPLFIWYFLIQSGWPALTCFWLLSISFSLIIFLKNPQRPNAIMISLVLILLAGQTRPEYFILIMLIPLILVLNLRIFKEFKEKTPRLKLIFSILVFLLVLIILSAPILALKNVPDRSKTGCGFPSQESDLNLENNLPAFNGIDKIIKSIFNQRFSLYYFWHDLASFFAFWTLPPFLLIWPFLAIGLWINLKERLKISILLLSPVIFLSLIYLLDCNYYENRYAIPLYGLMAIFGGGGYGFLFKKIKKYLTGKGFVAFFLIIILLIVLGNFKDYLDVQSSKYRQRMLFLDYGQMRTISGELDPSTSFIVSIHHNEAVVWEFLGFESVSLLDTIGEKKLKTIPLDETKDYESFHFPTNKVKEGFFLINRSYSGEFLPGMSYSLINLVFENYNLKEMSSTSDYILYKLIK